MAHTLYSLELHVSGSIFENWDNLVYSLCSPFLFSLSHLNSYLFPGTEMHWKRSVWLTPWEALYKYLYTIQYNTVQHWQILVFIYLCAFRNDISFGNTFEVLERIITFVLHMDHTNKQSLWRTAFPWVATVCLWLRQRCVCLIASGCA